MYQWIIRFKGAGHNDVELYNQYLERLKTFVSHELTNWHQPTHHRPHQRTNYDQRTNKNPPRTKRSFWTGRPKSDAGPRTTDGRQLRNYNPTSEHRILSLVHSGDDAADQSVASPQARRDQVQVRQKGSSPTPRRADSVGSAAGGDCYRSHDLAEKLL